MTGIWQDNVPPHPSSGGWALIMDCLCRLRIESREDREHVRQRMADLIAKHGEPSRAFAAAWLKDHDDRYSWLSGKFPRNEYVEAKCWSIEAARQRLRIPRDAEIPFSQADIYRAIDAHLATVPAQPKAA